MRFIFRPKADEPQLISFVDGKFASAPVDAAGNFIATPGLRTFAAGVPFSVILEADRALAAAACADPRFHEAR